MSTGGQVLVAVMAGVPSFLLGYLVYRRSKRVDRVSEQSGVATENRAGIAQIVAALQADNASFRGDLQRCEDRYETLAKDHDVLRREVNRLYRKYGENGSPP